MDEFKNVKGYINISSIENGQNIEINKDTVYIRSNIKQFEDNAELYQYDELQMTYEEYEKYNDNLYLNNIEIIQKKVGDIYNKINQEIKSQIDSINIALAEILGV